MHFSHQLKYHETSLLSVAECRRKYVNFSSFHADKMLICTHSPRGKTVCGHDSGSPLTLNGTLIGIASVDFNCVTENPDIFTNVYPYVEWIESNTQM